jgi:hypothetical protein
LVFCRAPSPLPIAPAVLPAAARLCAAGLSAPVQPLSKDGWVVSCDPLRVVYRAMATFCHVGFGDTSALKDERPTSAV